MEIEPFATEHFYAQYEFNTPYQLCNSDCETLSVSQLLSLAGLPPTAVGDVSLGYTDSAGSPALRQAISQLYKGVAAEELLVLGTPIEGIYLTGRALLEPHDEVVVLTPAYDALVNLFAHIVGHKNVKRWAFQPTSTAWTLSLQTLRELLSPQTKLVVLNFPHNPTGFVPTPSQFTALVELVAAQGAWLFVDEMYRGLYLPHTNPIPSAVEMGYERALTLAGLSKTYGLPGLRTGWLSVPHAALRARLFNWKFYTSICPPSPSEFLAQVALQVGQQLILRNQAQINQNVALFEAFVARWPHLFRWRRPQGGSTALVEMLVPSVTTLAHTLAQNEGILIQPATTLGCDDQHMRVGLGRAAFGEALAQFETYLHRQS